MYGQKNHQNQRQYTVIKDMGNKECTVFYQILE
jgi:hypothetical protein